MSIKTNRCVVALSAVFVVACSTRSNSPAGDASFDSRVTMSRCETDFMCMGGLDCECLSGSTAGTSCCHPDDCPTDELQFACTLVCEACTGNRPDASLPDGTVPDAAVPDADVERIPLSCSLSTGGCWQNCIGNGDSTSYCAQLCDEDSAYGCYKVCLKNGDSTSYCTQQCGILSAEAQAGCAEVCLKNGDSTSYCTQQCGLDIGCGQEACASVCIANGDSTSYCAQQCTFDTTQAKDACRRVCAANGDSTSYCEQQCA